MFGFLEDLRKSREDKRQDALTAYLDGALAPKERQRFERRLAEDEALRLDLEQQRLIKQSLGQLPRLRSPRNFTLDPAVYGRPQRQPLLQLYPALRTATVLVGVFFIIAVTAEIITTTSSGTGMQPAPIAEQRIEGVSREVEAETVVESVEVQEEIVAEAELPLAAEEAPMEEAAAESAAEGAVEDSAISSAADEGLGNGGQLSAERPPSVSGEAAAEMPAAATESTGPEFGLAIPMVTPTITPGLGPEEEEFAKATQTASGSTAPDTGALSQVPATPPVLGTAEARILGAQPSPAADEALALTLSPLRILVIALGLGLIVFATATLIARRRS